MSSLYLPKARKQSSAPLHLTSVKLLLFCSSMADSDSDSYIKAHPLDPELTSSLQPSPSKSCTNFLFKSLVIALVIIVIPLFPSQAPEFINQTILTKFWELIHLMFIGIAVCYGLISRRNVAMTSTEPHSNLSTKRTNLSGIFENLCGSEEKRVNLGWDSNGSSVLGECKKPRSSISKNCLENPHWSDESYCFEEASMVMVGNGNYIVDQWGNKPKSEIDCKPLGLPVRSLRSRTKDISCSTPESETLRGSTNGGKLKKARIRGLVPINLEDKFNEAVVPSPVPWRSRSGRMEMRGEENFSPHSHSRPSSVGNFFDCLKSHSFRSVSVELPNSELEDLKSKKASDGSFPVPQSPFAAVNGEASFITSRTRKFSIGSSVEMNVKRSFKDSKRKGFDKSKVEDTLPGGKQDVKPKLEDLKSKKASDESFPSIPQSPFAAVNGEASFITSRTRKFSIGSSVEMNVETSFEDSKWNFDKSKVEDTLPGGKQDVKPAIHVKTLPRGKSVRTIRPSEQFVETSIETAENNPNQEVHKVGVNSGKTEEVLIESAGRMARSENLQDDTRKQSFDNLYGMPNSSFFENQDGKEKKFAESSIMEPEKDLQCELNNFQMSSDEAVGPVTEGDVEPDTDEVDRKAAEFIAKFREQIRLQKVSSVKGSRLNYW